MKWEIDFSELSEFTEELRSLKDFDKYAKRIVREIGKTLIDYIKPFTPVETTRLINGWDKRFVAVTKEADGYSIRIVNNVPYARDVNDGHMAYNQYGGPYVIKNRVKVPTPSKWQQGDDTYFVYGHFFVEKGKESLIMSGKIEDIVYEQIQKWWSTI